MPNRKVGDKVFDLPSQRIATIVEVRSPVTSRKLGRTTFYRLKGVPRDPTKDGAFPTPWRLSWEVCNPKHAKRKLKTFMY